MLKENKERFGLRKLSVGLASVVLGVTTMSVAGHTVHADTLNDRNQGTTTLQNNDDKTADSDTQKSAQVVKEVKSQVEKADTTIVRGGD